MRSSRVDVLIAVARGLFPRGGERIDWGAGWNVGNDVVRFEPLSIILSHSFFFLTRPRDRHPEFLSLLFFSSNFEPGIYQLPIERGPRNYSAVT